MAHPSTKSIKLHKNYSFDDRPDSLYEKSKLFFGVFFLIPLRIILISPLLLLSSFIVYLSNPFKFNETHETHSVNGWERFLMKIQQKLIRTFLFIIGFYRIEIKGERSKDAKIMVSNHIGFTDPPIMAAVLGCSLLAKEGVSHLPFIGPVAKTFRCIFVDRNCKKSREKAVTDITRRSLCNPEETDVLPLMIFPEGTTSNGHCVIPFKNGAFRNGPVQPVAIRYHYKHFNPAYTNFHEKEGEVVKTGSGYLALRFLSQFSHHIEVTLLPVRKPSTMEKLRPEVFAENVRKEIADHLKLPLKDVDKYLFS